MPSMPRISRRIHPRAPPWPRAGSRGARGWRSSASRWRARPGPPWSPPAHRAGRHPDIKPAEPAPRHGGYEQQRPTVEGQVGVKLSEPRVHRFAQVHGRGPGIVNIRASCNPEVEAWLAARVEYAAVAARVEEYLASITPHRRMIVLDGRVESGNRHGRTKRLAIFRDPHGIQVRRDGGITSVEI